MLLTFLTSIILARLLGTQEFGLYTYAMSWLVLLVIPATMGFDGYMGKEVAIYQTRSAWGDLLGLIKWGQQLSLIISFVLMFLLILVFGIFRFDSNESLAVVFAIAMVSLPLITFRRICRGTMRGLHKIVYGLIPEMLLGPLLLLFFIGCLFLWRPGEITAAWAMSAFSLSSAITVLVSLVLLNRFLPEMVKKGKPRYQHWAWVKLALPFMFFESINIINERIDILMLGSIKGVEAAGIYAPVNRGAQLIMFILIAFVGPLSPKIASLYTANKIRELQTILKKTYRLIFLVSGILTCLMILLGYYYLLIFGPEFTQGLTALKIRCVGRFLLTTVGLSSMTLSMSGFANLTAYSSLFGAILNISLNLFLIPAFDINGAALATTISVVAVGILNSILMYRKTGVNSTIFRV